MKLIYTLRKYQTKDNKEKVTCDFYLDQENGARLLKIQPTNYGSKGTNFIALKTIAIYVKDINEYGKR